MCTVKIGEKVCFARVLFTMNTEIFIDGYWYEIELARVYLPAWKIETVVTPMQFIAWC